MSIPTQRVRFGVAGAAAAVIGGFLLWAVLSSWHPLRPRLVCVMPLGNGQTAAFFGYTNHLDDALSRPIGEGNYFEPGAADRKQPTTFPGKVSVSSREAGFAVAFAGESLAWVLDGRRVVATPDAPQCPMPKPMKAHDDVAWVKPKPVEPPKPEPPKPEPPKPEPEKPKEEPKPEPPKPAAQVPRVKPNRPPPPTATPKPPEPVPLALEGLTNLGSGIVVAGGTTTTLGSPEVEVTRTNTEPEVVGVPGGVPGGSVEPAAPKKVVRTPPKVKVRPRGEWPADAPPRAGAVLVKLSLLVGADGKVEQVKVVKGAGAAFDREAKAVGMQAVFSPATEDGKPVAQWVPWVVEFTPDGG